VLALSLSALSISIGALAHAGVSPVALGEVKVRKNDAQLERRFREVVASELAVLDLSSVKARDRYVLSAALVQMTSRAKTDSAESVAVVSATLRRERGGTLTAIIAGRAQAVEGPSRLEAAEQSAMRAAVRSALTRLPEALK
jgi:hypothetical protein